MTCASVASIVILVFCNDPMHTILLCAYTFRVDLVKTGIWTFAHIDFRKFLTSILLIISSVMLTKLLNILNFN